MSDTDWSQIRNKGSRSCLIILGGSFFSNIPCTFRGVTALDHFAQFPGNAETVNKVEQCCTYGYSRRTPRPGSSRLRKVSEINQATKTNAFRVVVYSESGGDVRNPASGHHQMTVAVIKMETDGRRFYERRLEQGGRPRIFLLRLSYGRNRGDTQIVRTASIINQHQELKHPQ